MERWTRWILRYRWPVLVAWLVVLLAGGWYSTKLSALLSNTFTMPGTDSERARTILKEHYGDRSDGSFTVVFTVRDSGDGQLRLRLQRRLADAATAVPTGRARLLVPGGEHVLYGDIVSTLDLATAKRYTDDVLRRLPNAGGVRSFVTGQAAIQHDLDPIFNQDLRKGEFEIAIPVALAVLVLVFGLSWAVTIPLLFAACTIEGTLGLVYVFAHYVTMATYVTNLVQLIGLGIAIDYSLLVVYRFREELERGGSKEDAVVRTMATAGRAVVFSGATVAIGLALLLFMPSPFMQSMGIGGFLIPLVSILAATTLQPALLSLYGRGGTRRIRVWRLGGDPGRRGFWERLAAAIMRRPAAFLVGGAALLVAAALPLFALKLTPGSAKGIPQSPQAVHGFAILSKAVGAGALSPTQLIIDTGKPGGVASPRVQRSIRALVTRIRRDPEVVFVRYRPGPPFVDASGRYAQIVVAGKHEYGEGPAQSFVHRLRGTLIPPTAWPAGVRVLAGGGPPQGVDFIDRSYAVFPWLVLGVLVLTYLLLMRAFRSLLLPLKAVLLNLLSVGASYGLLVVVFKWGVGKSLLGLYEFQQIEAWIPIFLFAMLFGLSMDYEVFLVTRMREAWDETHDNVRAVGLGLERTGRIVTAAAIVMVAAFSGFVAGRVVGLQEFGLGLAVAIFVDATIVRALLVPSLMALFGRWNWWLPTHLARVVRVPPSPLSPIRSAR
ncbi:MAG: putative drug exporter of the superfamily [Gaiellaceae bacterium]|nr:putative drug exporter of the superfamily [Gaiellaceae bacterium]